MKPIIVRCPGCPIFALEAGDKSPHADAGLVIAMHIGQLYPQLLVGPAEIERRRLKFEATARRN